MPIHSLSKETMERLKAQITELKANIKNIKEKTIEMFWLEDLNASV
jgi:hypothetical protein